VLNEEQIMSKRSALLVGSLNLSSASEVFEQVATIAGPAVKRIPDGETGERGMWVAWQLGTMARNPFLVEVESPRSPMTEYKQPARYVIKPGVSASEVHFDKLGYAEVALESYASFAQLKREGRIDKNARFQVALPTPLPLLCGFIDLRDQALVEPPLEAALLREMAEIASGVPHHELAFQWDVAAEIAVLETDLFPSFLKGDKAGMIERLARLGDAVPVNVEVGYHLCYGSNDQKHFKEPTDTGLMVEIANGIFARVHRPVSWFHMPVPVDRVDDAYFAPLRHLNLPQGTELYLGLLHHGDGLAGANRRMTAASRYVRNFGVASECGLSGRTSVHTPGWTQEMLALHRQVAEA
jgi:hypothetical protein